MARLLADVKQEMGAGSAFTEMNGLSSEPQEDRLNLMKEVIQWRMEKRDILQHLECETCKANPLSHDARLFGTDADGDLIFSNCFALPHDCSPDAITNHMLCLFERALRDHPAEEPEQIRKWSWVIDLHGFGWSMWHLDPRTSVKLLHLLQTAYRARLKRLLIVGAPFAFWGLWKAVEPFIKPATAKQIEFVDWEKASERYVELFGELVALELVKEGCENRDEGYRPNKTWKTFYGASADEFCPECS